jgi:hypothetical protein
MESLAISSAVEEAGAERHATAEAGAERRERSAPPPERLRPSRASIVPRSQARPGMSFGHDVLLAVIMAVAMAATVFLYR